MQFPYASPMLDDVYAKHGGMTGSESITVHSPKDPEASAGRGKTHDHC